MELRDHRDHNTYIGRIAMEIRFSEVSRQTDGYLMWLSMTYRDLHIDTIVYAI